MYPNIAFSEPAPGRDFIGTETMLSLVKVGRYAAHDIVREEYNLLESKVTSLKPLTAPDRRGRTAYESIRGMSSDIAI
jgi:hypothetical protein